jgi:hypothetical protein
VTWSLRLSPELGVRMTPGTVLQRHGTASATEGMVKGAFGAVVIPLEKPSVDDEGTQT